MRTHNNMTIQDYFRRSGVNPSPARHESKENMIAGSGSFSQLLDDAQAASISDDTPRGLSIRDYAARPVPARVAFSSYPSASLQAPTSSRVTGHPLSNADQPDAAKPASVSPIDNYASAPVLEISDEKDQILASIDRAATRYNLPASLIRAVVQAESSYQVRALSPAGAQGLMQLMPATAKELGVDNPYDIDQNIDGGAKYLRHMLDRFNGDMKLALSAYNAGPGTVAKFKGDVPYTETRNYVERVLRYTRQFS